MQSDFVKLNELMNEQNILYLGVIKCISKICKDNSMEECEKIEAIIRICDKFEGA